MSTTTTTFISPLKVPLRELDIAGSKQVRVYVPVDSSLAWKRRLFQSEVTLQEFIEFILQALASGDERILSLLDTCKTEWMKEHEEYVRQRQSAASLSVSEKKRGLSTREKRLEKVGSGVKLAVAVSKVLPEGSVNVVDGMKKLLNSRGSDLYDLLESIDAASHKNEEKAVVAAAPTPLTEEQKKDEEQEQYIKHINKLRCLGLIDSENG
jgi:Cft2 family RNA processing exonuclease